MTWLWRQLAGMKAVLPSYPLLAKCKWKHSSEISSFLFNILDMIRTFYFFSDSLHIHVSYTYNCWRGSTFFWLYRMLTLQWKNQSASETEHTHLRTQTFLLQVFFFLFLTKVSIFYRKLIFVRGFALKIFHFLIYLSSRILHEHFLTIFYLTQCWGKAGIIKTVNTCLGIVTWIFDSLNL